MHRVGVEHFYGKKEKPFTLVVAPRMGAMDTIVGTIIMYSEKLKELLLLPKNPANKKTIPFVHAGKMTQSIIQTSVCLLFSAPD